MDILKQKPFLSNFYPCSIYMNNKKYCSLDEIYKRYRDNPYPYKDIEVVMLFGTHLKFLQNKDLREKILLTTKEEFDKIRSKSLRDRLKLVKHMIWAYSPYGLGE